MLDQIQNLTGVQMIVKAQKMNGNVPEEMKIVHLTAHSL